MALLFLGKLLIAAGIGFQAYTLYEDKASATNFDARLTGCLKSCDMIPADIQAHIKEHLRLVVVGLLAFSGLMVLFKSCWLKVPVFLGLVINFGLQHYPLKAVPSYKDQEFWGGLAIIGGVLYLMGAESSCCDSHGSTEVKAEKKV